jgi:Ca2+-binding EF-hand superfamily protein
MTTKVTEEMMTSYREAFRRLDVDGTNSLKFDAVASVLCGEGTPMELFMMVLLFREYDDDNSGSIEECEFIRFCESIQNLNEVGILRRIFKIADKDKSGALDRAEVTAIWEEIAKAKGKEFAAELTDNTIEWLDRNGDQKVDFSEFCGLLGVVQDDEDEG